MGFIVPDLAKTQEDYKQVLELVARLNPESEPPPCGEKGNMTYVARDEDDRSKIVGLIHVEQCFEVRHLLVAPEFKFKDVSFTLLHRGMEMNMRINGVERYFFTVPKDDERVIKIFQRDGATPIDKNVIRFMKRL